MQEIELLFQLDDKLAKKIEKSIALLFVSEKYEVDTYLFPPNKDFFANKDGRENLRIRTDSKGKKELCYKRVHYKEGRYDYATEQEVEIENAEKMLKIFSSLGFKVHFVLEKKRKTFLDADFKYTIDQVKNLGLFLEIEWRGQSDDKEKARQNCWQRALELGLKKIQDKGYLRLLEEKQ